MPQAKVNSLAMHLDPVVCSDRVAQIVSLRPSGVVTDVN